MGTAKHLPRYTADNSFLLALCRLMCRHPIVTAGTVCFLSTAASTEDSFPLNVIIPAGLLFLCCILGAGYICRNMEAPQRRTYLFCAAAAGTLLCTLFGFCVSGARRPGLMILNVGLALAAGGAVCLAVKRELTAKKASLFLIISGFFMRLAYILTIPHYLRSHDIGTVEKLSGHVGYVAYLFFNRTLPQMDVRTVNQFYHPPLHHITAAVWVGVQSLFGIPLDSAWENIQILTLFYSCVCMILAYKIFRTVGIRGGGLVTGMAIIAFCPAFYILGGCINNDIMCIMFMLGAVLNTLYWFRSRSFGRIMCIAVCVGCAMMAKLSGWMVAPAIAFIFIYAFITDMISSGKKAKTLGKYAAQFGAFLSVSAPLGLWWGIRNLLRDGVPITYVLKMSDSSDMYVGDVPVLKRLFDFDFRQFAEVGDGFVRYGSSYNEYNPLMGLIKTSVFDELFTAAYYPDVAGLDQALFWTAVILSAAGAAAMIFCFIFDGKMKAPVKIFLGGIYGVIFIAYYAFCIAFPHVCTMNIRYAVPLIVIGALFIGRAVQLMWSSEGRLSIPGRIICGLIAAVVSVYSLSSVLFYETVFTY